MAATNQNLAGSNSLDALGNILKLFGIGAGNTSGTTTTSTGGTETTSVTKNVDPATVAALMQNAVNSVQGLNSITSGERASGLYNSSTNQLLVNDFLAKAAAQAAAQSSGTTTTTRSATPQVQKTVPNSKGNNSKLLGGALLGYEAYKKSGLDKLLGGSTPASEDGLSLVNENLSDWKATGDSGISGYGQGSLSVDAFNNAVNPEAFYGEDNSTFSLNSLGDFADNISTGIGDITSGIWDIGNIGSFMPALPDLGGMFDSGIGDWFSEWI